MCSNMVSPESGIPPTFLAEEENAVWYSEMGWVTRGAGEQLPQELSATVNCYIGLIQFTTPT